MNNSRKYIFWLQILMGVYFLGFAIYRYVGNDNNLDAVNIPVTVIFGLVLPLFAILKLIRKDKVADE